MSNELTQADKELLKCILDERLEYEQGEDSGDLPGRIKALIVKLDLDKIQYS